MNTFETFVSREGTQYVLNRSLMIIPLIDQEVAMLRIKVKLMSDDEILNQTSGNGIAMGIPLSLRSSRLQEIRLLLKRVLKNNPKIKLTSHAIERIFEDSLLEDNDPKKRGWQGKDDAIECLKDPKEVVSVRLNVDHAHRGNTEKTKHLYPQLSLLVKGRKSGGPGRIVSVILSGEHIEIITVL